MKRKLRQPPPDARPPAPAREVLSCGALRVEVGARRAFVDGAPVELQPKVFDLLLVLLREPGVVHTREALFQRLWPGAVLLDGNLTTALSQLRRVLDPANRERLRTVPRVGYAFDGEVLREEGPIRDAGRAPSEAAPLSSAGAPDAASTPRPAADHARLRVAGALLAAVLLALAAGWSLRPQPADRPVLVVETASEAGDAARWVGLALRDGLLRRLGADPDLRVIDGAGSVGAQLAARARAGEPGGADYVLQASHGTPSDDAGPVPVVLTLRDARSGAVALEQRASIAALDLPLRADALGEAVRRVVLPGRAPPALARAPIPPAAVEAYLEALRAESRTDYDAARSALERAVALAPGFAEAELRLAEVLRQLGYQSLAAGMYRRLAADPGNLGGESQRLADARGRLLAGEVAAAIEAFRRLVALHPDEPRHVIELARALARGGMAEWREARALLDALASRTGIADWEVRRLLALAAIDEMEGRHAAAAAVLDRAVERATADGLEALRADALLERGRMHQRIGRGVQARADYEAARAAYARARLPLGEASAELNRLLVARWDDPPVDPVVLQARIEAFGERARRDFGASGLAAQGLLVLAEHRGLVDDEAAMRELARRARERFEALGDPGFAAAARGAEAWAELILGRPAVALALLAQMPERPGEGNSARHLGLLTSARAHADHGQLATALALAGQALAEARRAARDDLARSAHCLRFDLSMLAGDDEAAGAALARCRGDDPDPDPGILIGEARLAAERRETRIAREALAKAANAIDALPRNVRRDRLEVLLAHVLANAGALRSARERLGRVDPARIAADTPPHRVNHAIVQALLAAYLDGDPRAAAAWVARAREDTLPERELTGIWLDLLDVAFAEPAPDPGPRLAALRSLQARAAASGSGLLARRADALATAVSADPARRPGPAWLGADLPGIEDPPALRVREPR